MGTDLLSHMLEMRANKNENKGPDYPGTPHAQRVIDVIEGQGGVLEMLEFLKGCVEELPEKAHASSKSEMERSELEETRLDAHQALLAVQALIEEIKLGIDMAATP
ncbi:unnamed protein product [Penicillium bialowiezense]